MTTAASGRLFKKGLLIKHSTALERLAEVDTVMFDKTGTLTNGAPVLDAPETYSSNYLSVAMALAIGSAHPLSKSVAKAASTLGVSPAMVEALEEIPGYGTKGLWQGQPVMLGRAAWMGARPQSATATYLKIGEAEPIAFRFTDALRQGAAETVTALQDAGKQVILISGDTAQAVETLADALNISRWTAEALPSDKVQRIQELTDNGHKVLMVGDGLNDTAALTAAHVSISPASALDAARVASDIVLLGNELEPIVDALSTAVSARKRIRENFRIATIYNVIAVPIAILGLATPLVAALAMSASSITVSLNALRLR